jgi:dihydroorotate dehydrogenase (fumarate)
MGDLSTNYLGLSLKNPIIVGSSSLTSKIESIIQLNNVGAAAIVLNSVFEEEIMFELGYKYRKNGNSNERSSSYMTESLNYIETKGIVNRLNNYLRLIREAKSNIEIPIIASVNCISDNRWIDFIKEFQDAGADALELNLFMNPVNVHEKDVEKICISIIEKVLKTVTIPVSVKIGDCFTNLSKLVMEMIATGIAGLVLFNRYYLPDIDLYNISTTSGKMHSCNSDYSKSLHWIANLSTKNNCSFAACTGIHESNTIIKQILAGADAVQIVSAIYLHGKSYLTQMLEGIEKWMLEKGIFSLQQIKGKTAYDQDQDSVVFERIQFMKYFGRIG